MLSVLLNENRIVKQEEVMNLLIKLVHVGRVAQIHFIFFVSCSRNLVTQEDITACRFSGVFMLVHCRKVSRGALSLEL